jgi:iduronate 2-sulfatase
MCGLTPPRELAGKSVRRVLEDPTSAVQSFAVTQHPRPAYYGEEEPLEAMGYSLRSDRYRYTEWRSVTDGTVLARELYDHEDDPAETVNLASQTVHAATIEALARQLGEIAPVISISGK